MSASSLSQKLFFFVPVRREAESPPGENCLAARGRYFPVIDRYLREVHGEESDDDCCAGILGNAVAKQLEEAPDLAIRAIAGEAADLASHVIRNPGRYTPDRRMQERLLREWRKVARIASEIPRP